MAPVSPLTLAELDQRIRPLTRADQQVLPVGAPFDELLPWGGLRRGSAIGADARSVGFSLIAAATHAGSWAAMVGVPSAGLAAAGEMGVALDHLAVVSTPPPELAATVLAALVDAVDLVVIGSELVLRPAEARRLAARARERGAVLIPVGQGVWPEGLDARCRIVADRWVGLERGHGALLGREVEIEVEGRRGAARPRRAWCWLQGGPGPRWTEAEPLEGVADEPAVEQGMHQITQQAPLAVARAG